MDRTIHWALYLHIEEMFGGTCSSLQLLPLKRVIVWWGFIMWSRCSHSMKTSYTTLLNDVSGSMRLWGEASKTRRDIHMSRKCGRYPFWGDPQNRHFRGFKRGQKRVKKRPFLGPFRALKRPLKSLKKGSFLTYFRPKTAFIGGYLNNILLDGI
jgi:hypothetical protein